MSEKKLLPCPFCGGEAQVESECSWASTGGELMYYVTCSDCGVEGIWHHKKEEAIKAWNTRVPMQKIIEMLNAEAFDMSLENPDCKAVWLDKIIEIVKELGRCEID